MKQEKRISYQAGITRRPSDFLCKDGDLAECINLTTDTEELKPMVQPEKTMDGSAKILFVHRFNDKVRYICLVEGGYGEHVFKEIQWHDGENVSTLNKFVDKNGQTVQMFVHSEKDPEVTVLGKTLIMADDNGMHFAIWQGDTYKKLEDTIPEPDFKFWLYSLDNVLFEELGYLACSVSSRNTDFDEQEKLNDIIIGLYEKNLNTVCRNKGFCKPFFLRTALMLIDGSYINISQPILMMPSITSNSYTKVGIGNVIYLFTKYCNLRFQQDKDLSDWSDIVKNITVFVTDGVELYDLTADQIYKSYNNYESEVGPATAVDGIFTNSPDSVNTDTWHKVTYKGLIDDYGSASWSLAKILTNRPKEDIENDIISSSIFYKICELGLKPMTGTNDIGKYVPSHVFQNLVNQPRLDYDDYFSRSKLYPKFLYSYNSRLHLANVARGFFDGFHEFIVWDGDSKEYTIEVYIKTDEGVVKVTHTATTTSKQGYWFFYPDPRATHVTITADGFSWHQDLKEHPALNGAYYFDGLPVVSGSTPAQTRGVNREIIEDGQPTDPNNNNNEGEQILDPNIDDGQGGAGGGTGGNGTGGTGSTSVQPADPTSGGTIPSSASTATIELLPNYILVSEVYNPWVYRSTGYHRVVHGTVVGMATQTQALGQEEHGIHPLIVFTDRGLASLVVGSDGQYTNRVDEMPREVCINPACITETDGAVFFVSKKGLMVIVGNQVSCVSENLNGHPFDIATLPGLDAASLADQTLATKDWAGIITACQGTSADHETLNGFLEFIRSEKCRIAYDYIDSKLLIINPDFGFAYVYSMADNAISKTVLPEKVDNVVNDYPDTIMQQTVADTGVTPSGNVYSLYDKRREDEVDNLQTAFLLTRPMKLGGPLTVSSLRELVNVGFWDKEVVQVPMPANNETEANEAPAPGTETETPEETPTEISCVKSMVWVSDNLKKWYLMSSRFGAAAKYFRLGLFIKMLPTERLSGTIITEQERRTNNLRR